MQETTPSPTILERLYGLGEQLRLALEAGDVEATACLVAQRSVLIEQLQGFGHPAEADPAWRQRAAALKQQQHAIVEAGAVQAQQLEEALETIGHVRQARDRYTRRPARAPILNKNLCV